MSQEMNAAVFKAAHDVRVERVPVPTVREAGDAVVRIAAAGICGSDLWGYRGIEPVEAGQVLGHEWLGVVEDVGTAVETLRPGDLVLAPFWSLDGTCPACQRGQSTLCDRGGAWGFGIDVGGGQAQAIRVPFPDATLIRLPKGMNLDVAMLQRLVALTDVMPTGHHAALCAGVEKDSTVLVVGDGAVGLCAVLAARRLGAGRVLIVGRHEERLRVAVEFGADVTLRDDDDAFEGVREHAGGGADAVLECVGTKDALDLAVRCVRSGGGIGYVGMPTMNPTLSVSQLFERSISFRGGFTPAREYIPDLLSDVLDGSLDPSPIFSHQVDLAHVADGYRLMDERTAIKVLVLPDWLPTTRPG